MGEHTSDFNPAPRITGLYVENVKRLRVVELTPRGDVVQITGPNDSGKSSVLDAIYWALAGTKAVQEEPIRRGEKSATIRLELGEVTVTRRFTAGGSTLTVTSASGAKFPSPQTLLDQLLGALTLDPLEFLRMSGKQRLDTLRRLVPLEIDLDELDRKNAADYAERTELGRSLKSLEARRAALGARETGGAQPQDPAPLVEKLAGASQHNEAVSAERVRRETLAARVAADEAKADALFAELERLRAENATRRTELASLAPLEPAIDTGDVMAQLEAVRAHNAAVSRDSERLTMDDDVRALRDAVEILTQRMEHRALRKAAAIAKAPLPVPGLGFGDGDVTLNEVPLEQASTAQQWQVCVALAMAGNPKLRVIRIKEGSLLDSHSKETVAEMAAAHGFQVWMECVDESGSVGIVMHDGEVVQAVTA